MNPKTIAKVTKEDAFSALSRMCREWQSGKHPVNGEMIARLMDHFPAQYGPMSCDVAKRIGVSKERARKLLTQLETEGRIVRHQPYFCTIRWYVPIEGEKHGARDYRKERIRNNKH